MMCLDLKKKKGLSKEESRELGFEPRQSGEISQTGRQRMPDRWSEETKRALTESFQTINYILKCSKASRLRIGVYVELDMRKERV